MVKVASLRLGIDPTAAEAGAKRFNAAAASVQKNATRAALGVGKMVGSLAAFAGVAGTVRTIAGFELRIAALGKVAGATDEQLAALTARARELGAATQFRAEEAAEGLLQLARAGFTVDEQLAAIADTLDLATAAEIDLAEASGFVSNSIRQFGLDASEADRVASTFVKTANSANTDVRGLAEAMTYAGTIAGTLGVSVEETAALIGALGNSGIQASMAGTNLRGVLLGLAAESDKANAALAKLGLTYDEVNPATNNALDIFERLRDGINGLENPLEAAAIATAIFGRRNSAAAISMARQVDTVRELTAEAEALDDAHSEVARTLESSLIGRFRALQSVTQDVMLSAGDSGLTGALKGLVETAIDVVQIIGGVEDSLKKANTIALLVTAALTAMVATKIIRGLAALAMGLGRVAAGMASVSTAAAPVLTALAFLGLKMYQANQRTKEYRASMKELTTALDDFKRAERASRLGTGEGPGLEATLTLRQKQLEGARAGLRDAALYAGIPGVDELGTITTGGRTPRLQGGLSGGLPPAGYTPKEIKFTEESMAKLVTILEEQVETLEAAKRKNQERIEQNEVLVALENQLKEASEGEADALEKALQLERDREQLQAARQSMEDRANGYRLLEENIGKTEEAMDRLVRKMEIEQEAHRALENIARLRQEAEADGHQERIDALDSEEEAILRVTAALLDQNEKLADLMAQRALVVEFQSSWVDMFSDIITGAESAGDAFEQFARRMIAAMTELILKRALMNAFFNDGPSSAPTDGGGSSGVVLDARGGYYDGSGKRFASGGIVGGPTNFLYAGGRGLMGEAGPEAIMPIGRDSRGNLGVKVAEGGSPRPNITVQMTVNATDADSFRRSRGQIINDLERATTRLNRNTL